MKLKSLGLCLAFCCLLLATGTCVAAPTHVPDGFYAVARREQGSETQVPIKENELRLRYKAAVRDAGDEAEETVVVQLQPFVPLLLKEAPTKTADLTERTLVWVEVSLTEEVAEQLEVFIARHLGQPVAIVVGGEVIAVHTVREVIKGGLLQISRRGDDGCRVLFREVQENPADE